MPGVNDADDTYAFLDCGEGRRLERFGGVLVSRPAPGAAWKRGLPERAWNAAALSFARETGWRGEAPADWRARFGSALLRLRPSGAGRVGVFPEHAAVAGGVLRRCGGAPEAGALRALNLFAHTGLATLLLAAAGFAVVHVDGAAAAVKQARENAALSGLGDAPVRWLTDDAAGFLRRELRRGSRYDVILADPPSFGRGGKGGGKKTGEWKLERDLPELLDLTRALLVPGGLLALTCHSEGWEGGRLSEAIRDSGAFTAIEEEPLLLAPSAPDAPRGAPLPSGRAAFARARPASAT